MGTFEENIEFGFTSIILMLECSVFECSLPLLSDHPARSSHRSDTSRSIGAPIGEGLCVLRL